MSEGRTIEINVGEGELDLRQTLRPGQCFTWTDVSNTGTISFRGVLDGDVLTLTMPSSNVLRCRVHEGGSGRTTELTLRRYFRLEKSLSALDAVWRASESPLADEYRKSRRTGGGGVRLLRQEPVECLFSFICSQNNNVKRIAGLVSKLRNRFGKIICTVDGVAWHEFPTVESLATAEESELKALSLGYRAGFVCDSANVVVKKGGAGWLARLSDSSISREAAISELTELRGVGPKVAACVALYSLEKTDCIPVDVHVHDIARKAGVLGTGRGSSAAAVAGKVGDSFRRAFGEFAGWAQAVMFTASLEPSESEDLEETDDGTPPKKRSK